MVGGGEMWYGVWCGVADMVRRDGIGVPKHMAQYCLPIKSESSSFIYEIRGSSVPSATIGIRLNTAWVVVVVVVVMVYRRRWPQCVVVVVVVVHRRRWLQCVVVVVVVVVHRRRWPQCVVVVVVVVVYRRRWPQCVVVVVGVVFEHLYLHR